MAASFSLGEYECPARDRSRVARDAQARPRRDAADKLSPGDPDPSGPPGRAREVGAQFPDRYRRGNPAARSHQAYARRALVPTPPWAAVAGALTSMIGDEGIDVAAPSRIAARPILSVRRRRGPQRRSSGQRG
jgi:hypothetical protein